MGTISVIVIPNGFTAGRRRKETAEKKGIPPFVIAKNSHFVEIVNKEITTLEALKQINGFGKKKIEKYGKDRIVHHALINNHLQSRWFVGGAPIGGLQCCKSREMPEKN